MSAVSPARTPPSALPLATRTGRVLARRHAQLAVSAAAGLLALVLILRMAWEAGGYFPASYLSAAEIGFVGMALLLVVYTPTHRLSTQSLIALGGLLGLGAWSGVSAGWAPSPDHALRSMQLDLLYVALFGLALVAVGSGRYARLVVWATLAATFAIVGAGLVSRIYPGLIPPGADVGGFARYRLQYPLSYWNAYGALAAMGSVLAAGLAADRRSPIAMRSGAAAASLLMFVGMYLSLSRGAWLALAVGLIVLVVMSVRRLSLVLTLALVGAAAALALLRLRGYPALVDNPLAGSGQVDAGHGFGPFLLVLAAAVAGLQALLAVTEDRLVVGERLRQGARRGGLALVAVLALFAIVAYGLKAGSLEGWTETHLHRASSYVSRQWNEFLKPSTFATSGTARLSSARGTRSDLYRVAVDSFAASPLRGAGAGSFAYEWMRHRRVDEKVNNAHSLPLETLGELGLVGGLLLLALIGAVAASAVRSRVKPGGLARAQTAAVTAACAVWLAASCVDWDWQVPAVTGLVLLLAATLFPYGRGRRRRRQVTVR